jgi:predicted dehydrogenase
VQSFGIALVGYGGIGRVHAMGYKALPQIYGLPSDAFRIVGVATGRLETAEQAAREIGCAVWTDDYRKLLERDDVGAVDICVPNLWHEEMALAAARAGKHVYCEKPLATSAAQAWRMSQGVSDAGVQGQVAFHFRFIPAVQRARRLMDEGFVGRVFSFRGWYHRSSYISPAKPLSWRLSREISGGGALADMGSHLLDLQRLLLGEMAQVYATLDTRIEERPMAQDQARLGRVDVDDLGFLHLRTADGIPGTAEISRLATGATNDLVVEIFGEKGALRLDLADPGWLYVYDAREPGTPMGGRRGLTRVETGQRFEGQLAPDWTMPMNIERAHAEGQYQFIKAIQEGRPVRPDFRDGARVQDILEAAYLSSANQRWADVPGAHEH